jgi:hypothetical protein
MDVSADHDARCKMRAMRAMAGSQWTVSVRFTARLQWG